MPPHLCVIRFIDEHGDDQAFVARNSHGHPEEIVTNISYLDVVIDQQEEQPPPGTIAAQFVFLDTLWYALQEVSLEDLQEELTDLLYSPAETDLGDTVSYLHQHKILDSSTEIEAVSYVYEIHLPGDNGAWQVKIGENTHCFNGPVVEVFELASWDFSGTLSEAIR